MSSYPSLLVLGAEDENVYRFAGFKKPPEFVAELDAALARYVLYREGKDWDIEPPRPERIVDAAVGRVRSIPAPSTEGPSGLALVGERLWVAQGAELFDLDPANGEVRRTVRLPANVRGLCSDGERLYAVEYGWTAGKPIYVLDATSGEQIARIVTEANLKNKAYSAAAVAAKNGKLWVLANGSQLHAVEPSSGEVVAELRLEGARRPSALCFDGQRFIVGGGDGIAFVDAGSGKVERRFATHYPVRAMAVRGKTLFVMEQPIFGFDRQHRRIQVWPKQALIHVLELAEPGQTVGTGNGAGEAPAAGGR